MLTGRYSHNHGVESNRPPSGGYERLDKANTLPVWLRRRGYTTAHIGKYLNGYTGGVPPGWTEWYGSVDFSTYLMWGYTLNENGTLRTYGNPGVEDPALYQTDVYRSKAVDFIRRRSGPGRPFYLSVAFLAPHSEARVGRPASGPSVRPAPRHSGRLANTPLPRPPSFNEADASDKPAYIRNARRIGPIRINTITRNFRARQESLLSVDHAVREIVGALRATGELKNTYVVFTSDNGFFHGEHRVPNGKLLVYEPSSRVPLLIRGPGIRGGRTTREMAVNTDLAATILDATGAKPTRSVDGRSLIPFAERTSRRTRRPVLHEIFRQGAGGDLEQDGPATTQPRRRNRPRVPSYRAIRTSRWLWVEYSDGSRELYDRSRDPHQLRSRHADRRYRRTRAALRRELKRLAKCRGKSCRKQARRIPGPTRR
jgi:arylsulfatase A-like enzyme